MRHVLTVLLPILLIGSVMGGEPERNEPERKARVQALIKQLADESLANRQTAYDELRDTFVRNWDIPELTEEIARNANPEVKISLQKLITFMEGRWWFPNKGWITDTLPNIEELDLQNKGVTDLTPLKGMPNLKKLLLQNTKVADLTPLKGTPNLKELYLLNTGVTDLTPLKGMPRLRELGLQNTKVADLTPLIGMPNLTRLDLQNTEVADLTGLEGLPNLWELHLQNTKVADLTPLKGLPRLSDLYLENTKVADLTPLKGLPKLGYLELQNTGVTDLKGLEGLPELYHLDLRNTGVTDLTPLKGLPRLRDLNLWNTKVTDLTGLEGLPNLVSLQLGNTGVTDLTPLKDMPKLVFFDLQNTKVTNLTPLKDMPSLNWLILQNTKVTDLTGLEGLPNLNNLDLQNTKVADLTPLKGLPNLTRLELQNTEVTDLKGLEGMPNLKELHLQNTNVADLTPLKGMPSLEKLHLQNTKVADLTPLKGMPNLKELHLQNTEVTDLTPLKGIPNLEYLHLQNTKATNLTPLIGMPNLRRLDLQKAGLPDLTPPKDMSSLWAEAKRRQEETAQRLGVPVETTLDLGHGVKLELVLIPAGTFRMGIPEPPPVDEEGFNAKIRTGVVVLLAAGGLLLGLLGVVLIRAIRNRQRPQYSLAWLLVMTVLAGIGLLGALHWYCSARALADAKSEHQAALVRYLSSNRSEKPAHNVTISRPFYMGKYEVTQEQYEVLEDEELAMFINFSRFKGRDLPVEDIRWDNAQEFCKYISEKTGSVVRLPTEAEWEYACRAGTKTAYYTGDTETDLDRAGWYDKNSKGTTHPVGQKTPNAWGVHDMHGNVSEWCADLFETYKAEAVVDPQGRRGEGQYAYHGVRGGGWGFGPEDCRSTYRQSSFLDDDCFWYFGFRVVLEVPKDP